MNQGTYHKKEAKNEELPEHKNPAQFKSALIFGIIYSVILLVVAFTEKEFGNQGLYIASIIGGLANKDAITLSLSRMIGGGVDAALGWRLIMTAVISNFIMFNFLGSNVAVQKKHEITAKNCRRLV